MTMLVAADWLEGGCGGFPEAVIGPCRRRVNHIHSTAAAGRRDGYRRTDYN